MLKIWLLCSTWSGSDSLVLMFVFCEACVVVYVCDVRCNVVQWVRGRELEKIRYRSNLISVCWLLMCLVLRDIVCIIVMWSYGCDCPSFLVCVYVCLSLCYAVFVWVGFRIGTCPKIEVLGFGVAECLEGCCMMCRCYLDDDSSWIRRKKDSRPPLY